jgi:hypothetical protein
MMIKNYELAIKHRRSTIHHTLKIPDSNHFTQPFYPTTLVALYLGKTKAVSAWSTYWEVKWLSWSTTFPSQDSCVSYFCMYSLEFSVRLSSGLVRQNVLYDSSLAKKKYVIHPSQHSTTMKKEADISNDSKGTIGVNNNKS